MMPRETEPDHILELLKGILLLFSAHLLAGLFIFVLGWGVGSIFKNYTFLAVWIYGSIGFLFWQLIYVIPLIVWLRRNGKIGMSKGVMIGATLTALLNGACFLVFFSSIR